MGINHNVDKFLIENVNCKNPKEEYKNCQRSNSNHSNLRTYSV